MKIIVEPRQLKMFAAFCGLGVLVAIGDGLREPPAPAAPVEQAATSTYSWDQCVSDMAQLTTEYHIGERYQRNAILAQIKHECGSEVIRAEVQRLSTR